MQFNKDSNSYILIFLLVMVMVVAVSLAFINSALKPTITQNEVVDKKGQILRSVVSVPEGQDASDFFTSDFVLKEYQEKIEEMIINNQGDIVTSEDTSVTAFKLNFKKETRLPEEERKYPLYKYNGTDGTFYILPLTGLGLWDEVWGYMAVSEDYESIKGASFGHKAETPGLGARIVEDWFGNQYAGKKLFGEDGTYQLVMLKGENNPAADTDPYVVDGLSGATLTAQGVDNMVAKSAIYYKPFFEKSAKK